MSTEARIPPVYVIMHDGCDGAIASIDSGNPFHTLRGAKRARERLGALRQHDYYIVKFKAECISVRKAKAR